MILLDFTRFRHFVGLVSSKFFFCIFKQFSFEFYIKKEDISLFLNFVKYSTALRFGILIDIAVVDLQTNLNRFKLVYSLLSSVL